MAKQNEQQGDMAKLVITINNEQPVELVDLAQSMLALAGEYRQMLVSSGSQGDANEVKLYIKEVRSGSIVQELVPYAMSVLPILYYCNTIADFAAHISTLTDWFLTHRRVPDEHPVEKKSLQNLHDLVEPIAKDPGSSLQIGTVTVNGDVSVSLSIGSREASAMQNNIAHALRDLDRSTAGEYRNVVMYWSQARNNEQPTAGDKVVIESISKASVKVAFSSDNLKKRMLFDVAHPFEKAFVVDVWVETIRDKPVLYVVHECHHTIDRED